MNHTGSRGFSPTPQRSQSSGYDSCERETEQLAMGVSELVLQSPNEKSKLRADAAEFVPSWMKTDQSSRPTAPGSNANDVSDVSNANATASGGIQNPLPDSDISHYLLSDIQMYVAHLQTSPESFDDIAITILDLLVNFAYNDTLLEGVVNEIFRAGLEYYNFTYNCARLCAFMSANYSGYDATYSGQGSEPSTASFRDLLLKRCREEHVQRLVGPLPHLYNYGLLLADLFNQLVVGGRHLAVLGDAVLEVVGALLEDPNDGNVAGAVSMLKCCGATLDRLERVESGNGETGQTTKLDTIFNRFENLLQPDSGRFGLSEDGKTLIRNLLKTRADWIKYCTQSTENQQEYQPSLQGVSNDTVYFGPDGQVLTTEEAEFLEHELGDLQSSGDEEAAIPHGVLSEEDAIDDAYEEFLKMTKAKKEQKDADDTGNNNN